MVIMDKRTGPNIVIKPFSTEDYKASLRGSFLHRVMELWFRHGFSEGKLSGDIEHSAIEFYAQPDRQEAIDDANLIFSRLIQQPVWREFLSMVEDADFVEAEKDILMQDASLARIDLLLRNKDMFIVLDYKFAAEKESHIKQVGSYVSAIGDLNVNCRGMLFYISKAFSKLVEIRGK